MKDSFVIYLIRHGKTKCNEDRLYCGKSDVPLSEVGKKELIEKKNKTKLPSCKLNYTSGALRANETFEILYPSTVYEERRGFFEYDFGDFELKSYEMLKEDKVYLEWIVDKTLEVKCPNGESRKEYHKRISKAFISLIDEIKSKGEREALIVCHGGTIGTLLHLFYDNEKDLFSYQPSCGGGYKLKVTAGENIRIEILDEF